MVGRSSGSSGRRVRARAARALRPRDTGQPRGQRLLHSADVLVHAAYDLSLTSAADIWRVNVEGTRRLLEVAADARVRRILVLSSMSAFEGTTQLYGRAKLDIEAMTVHLVAAPCERVWCTATCPVAWRAP